MLQPGVNSTRQRFHIYAEVVVSACGMGSFAVSQMLDAVKVSYVATSSLAAAGTGGKLILLPGYRGFHPVSPLNAMRY